MTRTTLAAALLFTTTLAGSADVAGRVGEAPIAEPLIVPAVFDPAEMARGLCRAGDQRDDVYAQRLLLAAAATAAAPPAQADAPPLWANLGDLSFRISTENPMAQAYFDQGLRWIYGFNHAEAVRSFRHAQRLDPTCAMCFWGEAVALGPNINQPMLPAAEAPAYAAALAAVARTNGTTERERALIDAVARRYAPAGQGDRAALDQAYAQTMQAVHERFPADQDIAILYAESLMTLQPWDYWEADRATPRGRAADVIATLEAVLAENPDHAAAIHLYIHIVEASTTPERAEPYADRLGPLMPGAGHLVHMPSHLYYRVGRYVDSLDANVAAVAADQAYLAENPIGGIYQYGYYPHNIHFVVTSAGMAGDADAAFQHADLLYDAIPEAVAQEVAWVQVIQAAPYFNHALFSDRETIMGVPAPGGDLPYIRAMWHYMRAVAHAQAGDVGGTVAEAQAIDRISRNHDFAEMIAGGVPVPDLLRLALHVVEGKLAMARREHARAVDAFDRAVEIQDGLPYMEPPYWYYPVRQSLGAALLGVGQAEEAEAVFWQSLLNYPNNGWALYGLAEAHRAQGEFQAAAYADRLLDRAWAGDMQILDLSRL